MSSPPDKPGHSEPLVPTGQPEGSPTLEPEPVGAPPPVAHRAPPSDTLSPESGTFLFAEDGEVDGGTFSLDADAAVSNADARLAAMGVGIPQDVPGRGWVMLEPVAAGAMGEVLRARDRDLNRVAAAKVIGKDIAAKPLLASNFFGEAQITAQLDHPSIIPIYSLQRMPDGRLAYTMKLVQGVTLRDWLKECHSDEAQSDGGAHRGVYARLEVFLKICDALGYAHHRGVLHRDLKPANVMIGQHGEVYVMDWGIAELMAQETEEGLQIEGHRDDDTLRPDDQRVRTVVGTPGYMSPEQAEGARNLDARSDVYALGLILQEMLTLTPAVQGESVTQRLEHNQLGIRVQPSLVGVGGRARELIAIVDRAAAVDRQNRYESTADLAKDIRRFTRGDETEALPDGPWQALVRTVGKNRSAVAVLLVLSVVCFAALFSWEQRQLLKEREAAQIHERIETQRVAQAASKATLIDGRFVRLEGLLESLSSSTVSRLRIEAWNAEGPYWVTDFREGNPALTDLAEAPSYRLPLSFVHPVFLFADEVNPEITERALRLTGMRENLRRLMLRSAGPDTVNWATSRQNQLLAEEGVPVSWISVAFEDGLHLSFPGHSSFPERYDPRKRPWYRLGAENSGPTWGSPYVDSGSGSLNLPCSAPIIEAGEVVGVTSLKLAFDSIIGDLLDVEQGEAFLVDGEGRIVVRGKDVGTVRTVGAIDNRSLERDLLPFPLVVQRLQEGQSGSVILGVGSERTRVLYHQLHALGWFYVVVEPE